ncbi:MAG: PAS domain S-box protein [Ignavibacteria bacterium]|jgi:PAS domain S-box-containing protein|nr:PAS domain S-box protein [Ignavibacteria bacterium]
MTKSSTVVFEVFNILPDLYFLLDEFGKIQEVNNQVTEKLGYQIDEIKGKDFYTLLYPPSVLRVEHAVIRSLEKEETKSLKCMFIRNDTEIIEADLFISSYKIPNKKNRSILIVAKDMTIEKKKDIDLLRFYYVAENTVNPLQITDLQGKMVYVNPAFEKACGFPKEELLGKSPKIFSSGKHSSKYWDKMWESIQSGKVWVGEVENKKRDGEPFYTQLLISPILDNEKKVVGYFGIHRDLTEKRNLEKQLIHTQKMESIGTLAAGVAHEVGNPLASISALVQIVLRQTNDEFIKEKLELVKKQVTRISKIIRDLVDFSRPSNYELQLTNINETIKEAIEIVRVGKKAKNIDFLFDPDNSLALLPLVADQVQQVFVNILINAVDAIFEKQTRNSDNFSGEICVSSRKNQEFLILIFKDNGAGIKEDHISKIFEPFFTTKKEGKGTGLGLWVSYGIIKSFHGDITVENNNNAGTIFKIMLPLNPIY